MGGLTTEDHLELLSKEVVAMTAALRAADPAAAVPGCPGWTVRDLTRHVIAIHRWATNALDSDTPPHYAEAEPEGEVADAYADAAGTLLARLTEMPPEHGCWTLDRDNRTAAFWRRRQLHEVSLHRWDIAPYPMQEQIALDGVEEVIGFFLPRQVHQGRARLPEGRLELVSGEHTWTIGEAGPTTTVEGPAQEVLLGLWGRNPLIPMAWREANLTP